MADEETRAIMLRLADDYDRLGEHAAKQSVAEERAKQKK
jgi:hypothetical protein